MGAVAVATVVVAAASTAMEMESQEEQAHAQRRAAAVQRQQAELQAANQSNKEASQMMDIMSTQNAREAAAGVAPSSQSFFAIEKDTFNKYAEDQRMRDINKTLTEDQVKNRMNQIDDAEMFSLAGSGLNFAQSLTRQQRLNQLMGKN